MSNLVTLITALATVMGTDVKNLSTAVADAVAKQGDLTTLSTAHKDTLTGALNELKTGLDSVTNSAIDTATVQSMIDTGITGLVDGAPDALNTLNEIAAALAADDTAMDGILAALAKRVRVDAAQNFTDPEKAQGRSNIRAADADEVGDVPNADFVGTYNTAKAA